MGHARGAIIRSHTGGSWLQLIFFFWYDEPILLFECSCHIGWLEPILLFERQFRWWGQLFLFLRRRSRTMWLHSGHRGSYESKVSPLPFWDSRKDSLSRWKMSRNVESGNESRKWNSRKVTALLWFHIYACWWRTKSESESAESESARRSVYHWAASPRATARWRWNWETSEPELLRKYNKASFYGKCAEDRSTISARTAITIAARSTCCSTKTK